MRILITGSRAITNAWLIHSAIADTLRAAGMWDEDAGRPSGPVTIVHGAAPGADRLASDWADLHGATNEAHPAQWRKGKGAGYARNADMVNQGAAVCLAFLAPCRAAECARTDPHDSHGASGCAAMAEAAGIPVQRIREARR